MTKKLAILLVCGAAAMAQSPAIKAIYKLVKLNQTDAIFSCTNGQIPSVTPARGRVEDSFVILSCNGSR